MVISFRFFGGACMKAVALYSLIFPLFVMSAHAAPTLLNVEQSLPVAVTAAIAAENEMRAEDVHPIPFGALSWKGGVMGAVVFEDSIPNCAIYTYQSGLLDSAFAGAPCKFTGPPKFMADRNGPLPDVVFDLEVFLPNRGAMATHTVAFYYDVQKEAFCESQLLADWYQSGNRSLIPDLQDGRCAVGSIAAGGKS
jgi:hypothetical protein